MTSKVYATTILYRDGNGEIQMLHINIAANTEEEAQGKANAYAGEFARENGITALQITPVYENKRAGMIIL